MEKLPSLHNWNYQLSRLANLLNGLRITILISILIFLSTTSNFHNQFNYNDIFSLLHNQTSLYIWCTVYGLFTMLTFANPKWQRQKRIGLPNASAVLDILMILSLTYLMGGTSSGFGILVLPFLATSCLFGYGRYPLLYGGFAASLVILEIFIRYVLKDRTIDGNEAPFLLNQIMLIGAYYLVPILTSFAAKHLLRADSTVLEHRMAYDRISHLTQIITNRMQEAAIVVDAERRVYLFNYKAKNYFPDLKEQYPASFLYPLIKHWQKNVKQDFEIKLMLNNKLMYVRAIPLLQEKMQLLTLFMRTENDRLIEAQTVKLASLGQLTANLAHEIRNPLSALRQASELLNETENDNPATQKLCSIIEKNITRLDKMIEDVSSLNKRDNIHHEIIDLKQFWQHFIQEFQLTNPESQGSLKTQLPFSKTAFIYFDAMHLQQIMWNLCNNAWRHCQKKAGSIIVSIYESNNQWCIRFRDDGKGVAAENQPYLFDPFFTTEKSSGGTGLGLYVARELAHANKGDLRYIPKEKAFELILPKVEHE